MDRDNPDATPLMETGIPAMLRLALAAEGVKTIGDVRNLSDLDLICVRRVGIKSFELLREMFGPSRGNAQNRKGVAGERSR